MAGQHIRKGQDPWNLNIAVIGVAWAVGGGAFFLGPIELIRVSWTSQGAILPYFLHGLLAAALLLALAMVL